MSEFEKASARYKKAKDAYWDAESDLAAARAELTIASRECSAAFTKEVEAARVRVAVSSQKEPS